MVLKEYQRKRRFNRTPEPEAMKESSPTGRLFVVQKHAAHSLHFDFRLEMSGVLKSWAVPKGPSMDPGEKRLAVHVEDHPVSYGAFEGIIPEDEYGGGTVMLWDHGEWEPVGDPGRGYRRGRLKFILHGEKLRGAWILVQMKGEAGGEGKNWLLIKERDEYADPGRDILAKRPNSVASGRSLDEIAADRDSVWRSRSEGKSPSASAQQAVVQKNGSEPTGETKAAEPSEAEPFPPQIKQLETKIEALGARPAALPEALSPQLATLVKDTPSGEDWLHEIKFDGYRILATYSGGEVRLLTRNGNDWTSKYPAVARAMKRLPLERSILDGEVVVLLPDGTTDFQALQNVMSGIDEGYLVDYLFDLPFLQGYDLRQVPLIQRKQLLKLVLEAFPGEDSHLRYSDHIRGKGHTVFNHACRFALEGTVSKQVDSPYESRRAPTWVKVKCIKRQEFVIGGYTDPSGSRPYFGALLLGYYKDGELVYCGKAGTGFDNESLMRISKQLQALEQDDPPFRDLPEDSPARGVHWIRPELVAEIEFANWTGDGMLRQPSFQGLRQDKAPESVGREEEQETPGNNQEVEKEKTSMASDQAGESRIAGVRLTHPDRVLYPEQDVSKRELAEYYAQIEGWILPYVTDRPISLVRCPRGQEGQCFYQKHYDESFPDAVRGIEIEEADGEKAEYILIDDPAGLVGLVQIGVLELHPWGSKVDRLERPDMLTFDIDPAPEIEWEEVIRAARRVRERLDDLGLQSFVKTSGGKGLHVVVPLVRRSDWEEAGDFAEALAKDIADKDPERYLATASKAKRKGKIFIDYLRNRRGATSVAAYSTRAKQGAPVSTPIRWEEMDDTTGAQQFNIENLPHRLESLKADPWESFFNVRQSITKSMKKTLGMQE
jgi:bifunctional non-homologous end joining protein LigD